MSLEADHILATAASIPAAPRANQFFCTCNVDGNFWWYFLIAVYSRCTFASRWKTTKEAQLNTMPATNKLPEMEISRCLCSQIGEHDEMKKNSLTLFWLFRLCGTNSRRILTSYSVFFFYHDGELSNHEENILDAYLIEFALHNALA